MNIMMLPIVMMNLTVYFLARTPLEVIDYVVEPGDVVMLSCNSNNKTWLLTGNGSNDTLYKLGVFAAKSSVHKLVIYGVDKLDERVYVCSHNSTFGIGFNLIVADEEVAESSGAKTILIAFIAAMVVAFVLMYIYAVAMFVYRDAAASAIR